MPEINKAPPTSHALHGGKLHIHTLRGNEGYLPFPDLMLVLAEQMQTGKQKNQGGKYMFHGVSSIIFGPASRVAFQAGRTAVLVTRYLSQVLVIHGCLVVRMTVDTTKNRIVGSIGMAIGAIVPLPLVTAGVDGEELCIMDGEIRRFPSGQGGMAFRAVGGKFGCHMARIRRGIVIVLVT